MMDEPCTKFAGELVKAPENRPFEGAPIQEICHLNQPLIFWGELAVSFREYDFC